MTWLRGARAIRPWPKRRGSHHRAHLPGHEFGAAEAQSLASGVLTGGDAQEQFETLSTPGLDADALKLHDPLAARHPALFSNG
ncbi:MAG: hypothetical protein H5U12_15150 [Hoeflea sp.]|nr:hypothetical protein [Hoeflea sp.]